MMKENFIKLYESSFKDNWELPALTDYPTRETLTYGDLAAEIAKHHLLFQKMGLQRGDKVSLIGKNNIKWCVTYLSVVTYGGVIVPILQDFHPDSVRHIINHSDSVLLFVSPNIWEEIENNDFPLLRGAISLEDYSCFFENADEKLSHYLAGRNEMFSQKYPHGFAKDDISYPEVDNSEIVLLNYTSGTTGFSKGVMLTANNLCGNVVYAHELDLLRRGERMLSFLPLAHAYGCAFDFLYALTEGVHTTLLCKTPSPNILLRALKEVRPHIIITVPLVIEKLYKKVILPKLNSQTMKLALTIPLLRKKIYAKILASLNEALGGAFREVIIGGAAFNQEVEEFLTQIKFHFTVGYGMTECAPLISYNHYNEFVPASCGEVLRNIMEARVDKPDEKGLGEIQVRGENVMKGYYKNEEATEAAFTADGWLRTGDLGTIDKTNRIFLKGRCKTMLLGGNGQNIFPEEIESRLNNMPYIMESLVVVRNQKLVALVYPDNDAMDSDGITEKDLEEVMEANRQALNKKVASYEQIAQIHIYPTEFEKTPKKSIKRYLYEN